MSKSWRSNAHRSDYSQQYYFINFRAAERADLNCYHHKKRNNDYKTW